MNLVNDQKKYGRTKRIERALKSLVYEPLSISVQPPAFYAQRFISFVSQRVLVPLSLASRNLRSYKKLQYLADESGECRGAN